MVQISGENSNPFLKFPGRMKKNAAVPPTTLSKGDGLKDIGHIMSIGNLLLAVNSVRFRI